MNEPPCRVPPADRRRTGDLGGPARGRLGKCIIFRGAVTGVAAAGLPPPAAASAGARLYGLAAHPVSGVTLEGVRALLAGKR